MPLLPKPSKDLAEIWPQFLPDRVIHSSFTPILVLVCCPVAEKRGTKKEEKH